MGKKYQKITVGGFLVVNKKVLTIKRSLKESYLPGYYELPGGKVDFGEHPKQSLEREFIEETNLKIKVLYPYRVFTYISHTGHRHTVELVYLVELDDNVKNIKISDAHDDYKWVSMDKIESVKMSDEIKINIQEGFKIIKK